MPSVVEKVYGTFLIKLLRGITDGMGWVLGHRMGVDNVFGLRQLAENACERDCKMRIRMTSLIEKACGRFSKYIRSVLSC